MIWSNLFWSVSSTGNLQSSTNETFIHGDMPHFVYLKTKQRCFYLRNSLRISDSSELCKEKWGTKS